MKSGRSIGGVIIAVLVAVFMWWAYGDEGAPPPSSSDGPPVTTATPESAAESLPSATTGPPETMEASSDTSESAKTSPPTTVSKIDPESGMAWIADDQLPPEAETTLDLIASDGPYPYDQDGAIFENREGLLPDYPIGYYREFTVDTPGEDDRGARRIVVGNGGEFYYTDDHYESFSRIGP